MLIVLCILFVIITVGTILVIQGQRRIPLQYARRIVGRHEVQGGNSHIPLKVNYAGVIPVSLLLRYSCFLQRSDNFWVKVHGWVNFQLYAPGSWVYMSFYVMLIIFFTYFWTATQFKPEQIASDMKKNGAFSLESDKVSRLKIIWSRQ